MTTGILVAVAIACAIIGGLLIVDGREHQSAIDSHDRRYAREYALAPDLGALLLLAALALLLAALAHGCGA